MKNQKNIKLKKAISEQSNKITRFQGAVSAIEKWVAKEYPKSYIYKNPKMRRRMSFTEMRNLTDSFSYFASYCDMDIVDTETGDTLKVNISYWLPSKILSPSLKDVNIQSQFKRSLGTGRSGFGNKIADRIIAHFDKGYEWVITSPSDV